MIVDHRIIINSHYIHNNLIFYEDLFVVFNYGLAMFLMVALRVAHKVL
jgi:hypothetical protein